MHPRFIASLAAGLIVSAFGISVVPKPLGPTPVVVELFTSQGCSSCPPAEALISQLRNQPPVIPLAFHVDYWDHLGWKDAFSSPQWTQRQLMYVRAMHLRSAYTPQAVVNGSVEFVGSSPGRMTSAIREASQRAAIGSVTVSASRSGNTITATVKADAPAGYDIVLALVENQVRTRIEAGENAGTIPMENAIVRRLRRVSNGTVTLPADPSWRDLGVVVFLQNRATLSIGNAAASYHLR